VKRISGSVGIAQKRVDMTYDAASQMTGVTRYSDLAGTQSVAKPMPMTSQAASQR
jgi:hypothetical protein